MTERIVITGALDPKIAPRALAGLMASVAELRPDKVVCFEGATKLLDALREVHDGPIGVHIGEKIPGVVQLPEVYDIAPGWVSIPGQATCPGSRIAGNTALNAAKRFNKSVVMGHTHRLGMGSYTTGYGGDSPRTVTGVEVGTLADTRGKRRTEGWQQGFALLMVSGGSVSCSLTPLR
ncbi:hypothetical protein QN239_25730 [Mycolicibacterium sp. Y3]